VNVLDYVRKILELDQEVYKVAEQIYKEKSVLVMGRGYNFSTCLEGALKIKVITQHSHTKIAQFNII
jgi:glucosamine--fructose-6-phosphate aminotransferase (isomerizing)